MQVHNREFKIESLYNERPEVTCLNTEQYTCRTRNIYIYTLQKRKSKVNIIDASLLEVNKKNNI